MPLRAEPEPELQPLPRILTEGGARPRADAPSAEPAEAVRGVAWPLFEQRRRPRHGRDLDAGLVSTHSQPKSARASKSMDTLINANLIANQRQDILKILYITSTWY